MNRFGLRPERSWLNPDERRGRRGDLSRSPFRYGSASGRESSPSRSRSVAAAISPFREVRGIVIGQVGVPDALDPGGEREALFRHPQAIAGMEPRVAGEWERPAPEDETEDERCLVLVCARRRRRGRKK
jgi:hypothetical protein